MAKSKASSSNSSNSTDTSASSADTSTSTAKSGTEVQVLTFAPSADAVVPDGWEIQSVDHDRTMGVTRVTVTRPYDEARSQSERDDTAATATVTPTYPQTAGGVPEPPSEPSTSYPWGTLDTTKVQNIEEVKRVGPTIAEQEAAGMPQENKDATEVASQLNAAAIDSQPDPAYDADKPKDSASKEEAQAAGVSPAQGDVNADNTSGDSSGDSSK